MREWARSSSPLLIGQSLELWSGMFRQALVRRAPAALVGQARGQLDAGAQAIDVNLGVDDPGQHLGWVASALRDALPETPLFLDCGDVVYALPEEVRRVEVEPELGTVPQGLKRPFRRHDVIGDLGRMDLQRELHAAPVELVENGVPHLSKVPEPVLDHLRAGGGEAVDHVPDG